MNPCNESHSSANKRTLSLAFCNRSDDSYLALENNEPKPYCWKQKLSTPYISWAVKEVRIESMTYGSLSIINDQLFQSPFYVS